MFKFESHIDNTGKSQSAFEYKNKIFGKDADISIGSKEEGFSIKASDDLSTFSVNANPELIGSFFKKELDDINKRKKENYEKNFYKKLLDIISVDERKKFYDWMDKMDQKEKFIIMDEVEKFDKEGARMFISGLLKNTPEEAKKWIEMFNIPSKADIKQSNFVSSLEEYNELISRELEEKKKKHAENTVRNYANNDKAKADKTRDIITNFFG